MSVVMFVNEELWPCNCGGSECYQCYTVSFEIGLLWTLSYKICSLSMWTSGVFVQSFYRWVQACVEMKITGLNYGNIDMIFLQNS